MKKDIVEAITITIGIVALGVVIFNNGIEAYLVLKDSVIYLVPFGICIMSAALYTFREMSWKKKSINNFPQNQSQSL